MKSDVQQTEPREEEKMRSPHTSKADLKNGSVHNRQSPEEAQTIAPKNYSKFEKLN